MIAKMIGQVGGRQARPSGRRHSAAERGTSDRASCGMMDGCRSPGRRRAFMAADVSVG